MFLLPTRISYYYATKLTLILKKTFAVERLREMPSMWDKAEWNSLILFAKIEEIVGDMGAVTVEYK